jgi:PAS domain S-box-containing protein
MADPQPVTILIVDDDEAKRYAIAKIIERAGFTSREAATGTEALRLVYTMPDLVILDVKLPDVSGFEVCRRIKADPTTASIPVLHLSTTFVDIEDKVQGLEGGADGYLTDVLEPLELIATVRALLRTRKAEEEARITSRQWQTTFDAINDGVILLDGDGVAVQANQAIDRILSRPWSEVIGRSFHELMDVPADREHSVFLRMLETQNREVFERTLAGRWLHVAVDPVRNQRGIVKGALCIVSDVTERREMEEELRRRAEDLAAADRRKDEFLAMLAHELRNPLAPILNCLELIRNEAATNPLLEQLREIAERQVQHMARLLEDLLDVSRFTQGKIQLRKEALDVSTVVAHAVETATPLVAAKGHQLTVTLPREPLRLLGDPTRLEQVVANLLNNAAKYSEPGGRITLTADREGDEMVLRVKDTGIGLSPEMQSRVFELFAQADLSLDRSQGGLGIGLTLVRSLVEHHGGHVSVHSAGLGQGSEFAIRLPLPTELPVASPEAAPPAGRVVPGQLRVLVVDDHRDSALSLARVLKSWGHVSRVAHNGVGAIEAVTAERFEVVLLDIGLPGMDGYEVAGRIRNQSRSTGLVLVALTGYGQQHDLRRSREAGFDRHLVKPVSLDILRDLLDTLGSSSEPQISPGSLP